MNLENIIDIGLIICCMWSASYAAIRSGVREISDNTTRVNRIPDALHYIGQSIRELKTHDSYEVITEADIKRLESPYFALRLYPLNGVAIRATGGEEFVQRFRNKGQLLELLIQLLNRQAKKQGKEAVFMHQ